jgi:hypothetical protein
MVDLRPCPDSTMRLQYPAPGDRAVRTGPDSRTEMAARCRTMMTVRIIVACARGCRWGQSSGGPEGPLLRSATEAAFQQLTTPQVLLHEHHLPDLLAPSMVRCITKHHPSVQWKSVPFGYSDRSLRDACGGYTRGTAGRSSPLQVTSPRQPRPTSHDQLNAGMAPRGRCHRARWTLIKFHHIES